MTILGKILVFVNFVFSLVTGALIVMVFITRTNWHKSYDDLNQQYTVAVAYAKTYHDEVDAARAQAEVEKKKIQDQLEEEKKAVETERDDVTAKNKQLQDQLTLVKTSAAAEGALTDEVSRRKLETEKLARQVADLQGKMLDFQAGAKKSQDEAIQAKIARDSEHQRNIQLVDLTQSQAKEIEDMRAKLGTAAGSGSAASATVAKPPPEDVQGVVMDSDPATGLVTISVGSDAGVNKGNTLEVYRLQPQPAYVGTIRIVDSRFHEAVGRAQSVRTGAGPIQKGDRVASRIAIH